MSDGQKPGGKLQLWLIILPLILVFAGAYLLVPRDEAEKARLLDLLGTSNKGELLVPATPILDLDVYHDGAPWRWSELKPKWRMIIPVASGCDQACRDLLYISRQVHIRLDKKTHRVERVLLNLGAPLDQETREFFAREHIYLKLVSADIEAFKALLASTNADWDEHKLRLFLADQRGDLMMYYTPEHEGAHMLADLRHLLKYSPEPK
ncbi:MAG TPA: hypothetical protein DCF62_06235 [Porticoccaceae bacterium]|nr:hypothetical protein [Porticoccaceae bacterium]HCO59261.1 hypothetical protein [Porticoccaceae bacterium]